MSDLKRLLEDITKKWKETKSEPFSKHPLAKKIASDFPTMVRALIDTSASSFKIVASPGKGNWAQVPWLSILDPDITNTTQDGIYPVYLFRADGTGVYLSLNQGTTNPTKSLGARDAKLLSQRIISETLKSISDYSGWSTGSIDLAASSNLGRSYEQPSILSKFYPADNIPDEAELKKDLKEIISHYSLSKSVWRRVTTTDTNEYTSKITSLPKPFLLLAGISGTGKTRFVREQATTETYQLVSVRPDWHEPSDLLGYISRLTGAVEYVATDVLKFMVSAWRATAAEAEEFNGKTGKEIVWQGSPVDSIDPYWLCLDEMNLAPVEQYFADYLSVLETRKWAWDGDDYRYSCKPLLSAETIKRLKAPENLASDLGLDLSNQADSTLWQQFCQYGIPIPFNLIVAGTVNMDETTHGFSRKVIDRALTIDFGQFFPNDFDSYFTQETKPVTLSFPRYSDARDVKLFEGFLGDKSHERSIEFLKALNEVLVDTPFELAFRALNELLLSVACFKPKGELELQAVWDDFLMCKVLPRIEGDEDKLRTKEGGENLLAQLEGLLENQLSTIWNSERPDLLRTNIDDSVLHVPCHSKAKLQWMRDQLSIKTFTSFWP